MNSREFNNIVDYVGQEKAARELIIKENLATVSGVALMTAEEVYSLLLEHYTFVYKQGETIGLVKKEDLKRFHDIVVTLNR